MAKIFKIVFCVLACACVAAAMILGSIFGFVLLICLACAALVFAILMFLCKKFESSDAGASEPDFDPNAGSERQNEEEEK